MKHPLLFIFSFILLIGNFSCKKDEPVPVTAAPVFYFKGNVGSTYFNLQAGIDNYYMYSGFNQDASTNVYSFNGFLNVYNCTACGNSPQFKINDFQATPINGNVAIGTSLSGEYYPYMTPGGAPAEYNVYFNSLAVGSVANNGYYWNFGDGTTLTINSPNATHVYARPGKYHVTHKIRFANLTVDSTDYNIRFGIPEAECTGSFGSTPVSGTTVAFSGTVNGTSPYTYYWDFGDGNYGSSAPPFNHTYVNAGVYKVYMRVTDVAGGVVEFMRNCPTPSYTGTYSGFYPNNIIPVTNMDGHSNVTVMWRDAAGETYTSESYTQPSTSYFKLISVEDYQNNSSGQRTKKIHINFKCKVFSTTTSNSLLIDNGDAVIAVAYQ